MKGLVCDKESNNFSEEYSVLLNTLEAKTRIDSDSCTYWPNKQQTKAGQDEEEKEEEGEYPGTANRLF